MKRSSQRLIGVLLLAALVVVAGCGSGRVVLPFQIDAGSLTAPRDASALTTHERAVRGLSAILVRDLGLPMPGTFTVYVYSGRQVFEQGLIQDAQVTPIRAAELSEFAVGIGKRRQLLLNDDAGQAHGREWLRLIAHELAHVSQIEMAGGEGRAEQWLAEGMSEYVAFIALERLSLDTLAIRRSLATAGIRNHAALVAARLDLETLGNPRGFTVRHLKEGSLPTYQLAFLMADYLIARDGFERVVTYFRSFERRQDRHANFRDTFGQSLEQFEQEVLGHLKTVVR
jgi:phosphohistidine swiveling domain-containing protein